MPTKLCMGKCYPIQAWRRKMYESRVLQGPEFFRLTCPFPFRLPHFPDTRTEPQLLCWPGLKCINGYHQQNDGILPRVCFFLYLKSIHGHKFHIKLLAGSQELLKTRYKTEWIVPIKHQTNHTINWLNPVLSQCLGGKS